MGFLATSACQSNKFYAKGLTKKELVSFLEVMDEVKSQYGEQEKPTESRKGGPFVEEYTTPAEYQSDISSNNNPLLALQLNLPNLYSFVSSSSVKKSNISKPFPELQEPLNQTKKEDKGVVHLEDAVWLQATKKNELEKYLLGYPRERAKSQRYTETLDYFGVTDNYSNPITNNSDAFPRHKNGVALRALASWGKMFIEKHQDDIIGARFALSADKIVGETTNLINPLGYIFPGEGKTDIRAKTDGRIGLGFKQKWQGYRKSTNTFGILFQTGGDKAENGQEGNVTLGYYKINF